MSEWEMSESRARVEHIVRLLRRGATLGAVRDAIPDATEWELQTVSRRVRRGR